MISPLTKALVIALLAVSGLCVFFLFQAQRHKAAAASVKSSMQLCHSINSDQAEVIRGLQLRNSELVTKNAVDLASSQQAAARYLELETQLFSLETQNEALREQMAQDDPQVGEWLASGMDHRVACSLWPTTATCKK